jgi:RNA polymerase sigma-70 factor (ECF subfamily)
VAKQAEERLLSEIRAGRREACVELIHAHYEGVYRFLVHLTHDSSVAEDLTQDTFATVWQKVGAFEGRSSVGTWLHRVAYRKFLDARRASKRRLAVLEQLPHREETPVGQGPFALATAGDEARALYAALNRLPERERVLLVLHYLQGQSYQEMVEILEEPSGTIKWRISQALEQLRKLMSTEAKHEHQPT